MAMDAFFVPHHMITAVERMTAQNDAGAPLNIRNQKEPMGHRRMSNTSAGDVSPLYRPTECPRQLGRRDPCCFSAVPPPFYMTPKSQSTFHISLDLPDGWPDVHTALPQTGTVYIAEDLSTLIDTRLMGTTPRRTPLMLKVSPTHLVNWGEQGFGMERNPQKMSRRLYETHPILGRYP